MNPESLDSSIQSALSSLFPPFDLTAPIVLSQLFRTIEEQYHGDALHCLLDFLIPAKHVLESVQQAACAGFCDVVFRCEGWPLCLHDKTVIQLAPVNPLLLRPGDFYLQVAPFGDQAARIVLKSLLEEGRREVEETPVLETSYPVIFTEEWLQEVNDGRHGTPLSRCLLCTDQGIVKMSWDKIAIPEFLDKPKTFPTLSPVFKDPELSRFPHSMRFNSSTLPLEMVPPPKHKMSASLRHPHYSSRVIKPDRKSKPLVKPVGWVSPNTWDRPSEKELEGDYVDLVEIAKERERMDKKDRKVHPGLIKAFRPPQPKLGTQCLAATLQYSENPFIPCGDFGISDEELKCRYRESYMAALKNPVAFEKGNVDLLTAMDELKCYEEGEGKSTGTSDVPKDGLVASLDHCKEAVLSQELCQFKQFCEPANVKFASHLKDLKKTSENVASSCTSEFSDIAKDNLKSELGAKGVTDVVLDNPDRKMEVVRGSGKHKSKMRSLSAVSESAKGSPLLHNRSHSDIYPEMINSLVQCQSSEGLDHVSGKQERRKSPKSESQSSPVQEPEVQTVKTFLQPAEPDAVSPDPSAPPEEGALRGVSPLLELGIICLPGSRDRTGRAVVEVHGERKEWTSPLISAQNICKLLLYLHTIPRREVSELGLTLIINSRKKPPPPCLYKALLMAQEQALHTVHSLILLVDKDTSPRPEKQTGLQMDVVTSLKALYKTVESSQLTPELGGTFVYCHTDWLQLHQKLVPFMSDLKGAESLLQKAIQKVEGAKKLDTAQDVQRYIEEQKSLMMEVLKDARLVMLQREGGAVLARVRKDQHRFPQSEDYRDALDSATSLYNQVEENLHALVMRSNRSLQHLDFLLTLREAEACATETGTWLNSEGEQVLKDSCPTEETLAAAELALQHFTHFITQAKEKQEYSSRLVRKAVQVLHSTTESSPTTEVFQALVSTFKSNTEDFMLKAEKRLRELETLVQVYGFCERASCLADECSSVLDQLELRCCSPQSVPGPLQMFEDRLGAEFSTSHFQAMKAQLRALGPGAMRVWNSAWERRQKVKQRLDEMQKKTKKKCLDKAGRVSTSADRQGSDGKVQDGEIEELDDNSDGKMENGESLNVENECNNEKHAQNGKQKPREHCSEADLTNCNDNKALQGHKLLGRSLSEGSKFKPHFTLLSDFSPLNAQQKQPKEENAKLGRKLSLPCTGTGDSGRGSGDVVPTQSPKDLRTPETLLTPAENNGSNVLKLQCILEELLSTEREYVKALGYVREQYFPELERPDVPQDLRGQRGSVFGNLEKLHDFHRHHFLYELESCVDEPLRVGRCFLRHRDSFTLYALYSKNKPVSDKLLIDHGKAFFKQKQVELGDRMDLWSYLLKPIQRISKYGLLLQDVLRECGPGQERELEEIRAALEVVQLQLRHGNNLLAMDAIHQCDVNLKEQGPLIRQDEFLVTFRKKKCLRHVFLFQELVLFSKTRKTEVGNETYVYKQSFKTSDIGMTQNSGDSGLCFEIWFRKRKTQDTYTLQAANRALKESWTKDLERILWEQALRNKEVRMQERVFLGIGNKPFMDIQPSDAAINTRAVNCVLMGKESRVLSVSSVCSSGSREALPVMRQKSIGSSSSSSSSSSGRGSLSPGGYLCGPKRGAAGAGLLEEDDLDQENGQNLLLDSSESSGESVSGLSSCLSSRSTVGLGPEADDASSVCSSVCSSVVTVKHSEAPNSCVGKSTEV